MNPLFDDLGYRPKPAPNFAEVARQLNVAAREFSVASRKFQEVYIDIPPRELRVDPAPDWR